MQTLYTIGAVEKLISNCLNRGYDQYVLDDGCLGLGTRVLIDWSGNNKTIITKEIALNEWSSAQSLRMYNKTPQKYLDIINNL